MQGSTDITVGGGTTTVARRGGASAIAKRSVDLTVGTVLAIVATPVILALAVVAAVHFRAWPFFTQTRLGRDGREFRILKIRSLAPQTDPYALKPAIRELELSRFSRFVRGNNLDELPQLWLVPFGRMALVGPRPKMPDEFEPVDPTYQHARTRIRQGCTCVWQIGEATDRLPSDSPEFDLFYLRYGSLRLDVYILVRTALKMVRLGRPIALHDIPTWVRGRGWVAGLEGIDPFLPGHGDDEFDEFVDLDENMVDVDLAYERGA